MEMPVVLPEQGRSGTVGEPPINLDWIAKDPDIDFRRIGPDRQNEKLNEIFSTKKVEWAEPGQKVEELKGTTLLIEVPGESFNHVKYAANGIVELFID